jgi:ABC-2 type transport system permease protein
MYNFLVQSYSTYKGLFYWLQWMSYVSNVILYPIAYILMYSFLGRFSRDPEASQYYALGIAGYAMAFIVVGGITQSYTRDRQLGTISFLFASPANRLVNYLSRGVLHYPNALLNFTFAMLGAWLIVDLNFGSVSWTGFAITVLVIAFSLMAYAQFMGVFAIVSRNWIGVMSVGNAVLFILCGAIIPITVFPAFIGELAKILPMTNGLFALRETFTGAPLSQVSGDILREFLTGLGYLTLGFLGFVMFERVAKRRGTLELEAL